MAMSFSGSLETVKLADVVQMCCLASVDGCIELGECGFTGYIFLRKSRIVHAEAAGRQGEEAFYLLLSLRQGRFEFRQEAVGPKETILAEWEYLLIEATRRKDEQPVLVFPKRSEPSGKLAEMLQMYCLAFMDGSVRVDRDGIVGHIYLREGQIVHAKVGKRKGEEALFYLLSLDGASFEFQGDVDTPEDSIYGHWELLLAEGARRQRELEADRVLVGDLSIFRLSDILHMCCLSGMDGDLQLIHDGSYGHIYLQGGQIVHAQAGLQKGEPALHFLLAFRQGSFEFLRNVASPEKTVEGQWEYLLLEAARLRDEKVPATPPKSSHGSRLNGELSKLVKQCVGLRGFKGAVVLSDVGEFLAGSFAPLEPRLLELVKRCATLYSRLENELTVEDGDADKCFVLNFQENSFVAIPQRMCLVLLLIDRKSSADPMLLDLVKTIRRSADVNMSASVRAER